MPGKHCILPALLGPSHLVLFVVLRRLLARGLPQGVVFAALLVLYGSWRFAIDYLRFYEGNTTWDVGHHLQSGDQPGDDRGRVALGTIQMKRNKRGAVA